jgi:hypothetical protein
MLGIEKRRQRLAQRTTRPSAYRPQLEALESLVLPSVDVFLHPDDPSKLVIQADGGNNGVTIVQDDTLDTLSVLGYSFTSSAIAQVVVKLGGGDDILNYQLAEGTAFTNGKIVVVDPGAGNDFIRFFVLGEEAQIEADLTIDIGTKANHDLTGNDHVWMHFYGIDDAELDCKAYLGAGNDTFDTRVMDDLTNAADVTFNVKGGDNADQLEFYALKLIGDVNVAIGQGAELNVRLEGGGGADEITLMHQGTILGKLKADVYGGNGSDTIYGSIVPINLAMIESNGYLDANFYGDAGSDRMDLYVNGQIDELHYSEDELPFIHGGSGIDHYSDLMFSSMAEMISMEVLEGDLVLQL